MTKIDTKTLKSKKASIRLGTRTIRIGDSKSVNSTKGGTTQEVLRALKELSKIRISQDRYGATD